MTGGSLESSSGSFKAEEAPHPHTHGPLVGLALPHDTMLSGKLLNVVS